VVFAGTRKKFNRPDAPNAVPIHQMVSVSAAAGAGRQGMGQGAFAALVLTGSHASGIMWYKIVSGMGIEKKYGCR